MTPNFAFVQWVKANHRPVYEAALKRVAQRNRLGGLGDDLLTDVSYDPSSANVPTDVTASLDSIAASNSNSASDIIDSIAGAVTSIAPAIVQTQAQLSTIQINAQRAAQGLPPLGSTSLLTGQGLSAVSPMVLLIGAAVVGGILLMKGKSAA